MKKVRITVKKIVRHDDLIAQYEKPIEHACDMKPDQVFVGKTFFLVWILMWIKWTFPRLRIDQILKLEWKYLMPLALLNLVIMTIVVALGIYIK